MGIQVYLFVEILIFAGLSIYFYKNGEELFKKLKSDMEPKTLEILRLTALIICIGNAIMYTAKFISSF